MTITPPDLTEYELPAVLYRVVAPSLEEPAWYEDEEQVLAALEEMAPPTEFAVIHKLTLGRGHPPDYLPYWVWARLTYQPPQSKGRLIPHKE
jgi:hypothetical protein